MSKNADTYLKIHVIADKSFIQNYAKCFSIFDDDKVQIAFYQVDNTQFKVKHKCIYKDEIFYRFYISQLLPSNVHKTIYLDADTIVKDDLTVLYNEDVSKYAFGAVFELGIMSYLKLGIESEIFDKFKYLRRFSKYCNSGMLLCNVDFLRSDHFFEKCIVEYNEHDEYYFVDQDIINSLYSDMMIKLLPCKYNCCIVPVIREDRATLHTIDVFNTIYQQNYDNVDDIISDATVMHFAFDKNLCDQFSFCKDIYDQFGQRLMLDAYLR